MTPNHRQSLVIVILAAGLIAQGAAVYPKYLTCPSLGCTELLKRLHDRTSREVSAQVLGLKNPGVPSGSIDPVPDPQRSSQDAGSPSQGP